MNAAREPQPHQLEAGAAATPTPTLTPAGGGTVGTSAPAPGPAGDQVRASLHLTPRPSARPPHRHICSAWTSRGLSRPLARQP